MGSYVIRRGAYMVLLLWLISIVSFAVIQLPAGRPALYSALLVEDMFLAGAIIMLLGSLTIVGTIISDFLLVAVDPRIRFGGAVEA